MFTLHRVRTGAASLVALMALAFGGSAIANATQSAPAATPAAVTSPDVATPGDTPDATDAATPGDKADATDAATPGDKADGNDKADATDAPDSGSAASNNG